MTDYLRQMGIAVWQARRPLPGGKPEEPVIIYQIQRKNGDSVGYLFLAKYVDSLIPSVEIIKLLTALFKAMPFNFMMKNHQQLIWPKDSYAIILGYSLEEQVKDLLAVNSCKIVTEDLIAMIRNPTCKRKVWQDLQPLVQKGQ